MKASGAGAGAQNVMGVGVFFGMLVATGLIHHSGNFTFVEGLGRRKREKVVAAPAPVPATADAGGEH